METIEATFKVVTPMFISGADQDNAELRLPSIKGALRFWWRALAWGQYEGKINKIREEEAKLFGSTDTGQAAVLMRLESQQLRSEPPRFHNVSGAIYLGYGVMNFRGELCRSCVNAGSGFVLRLSWKESSLTEDQQRQISDSLKVMGLLGGLGSKSRKGYGSITLASLKTNGQIIWQQPSDSENFKKEVAKLLAEYRFDSLPAYTAFSSKTKIFTVCQGETPLKLLNTVGEAIQLYRSYGRRGQHDPYHMVNGQKAEQNFHKDHDWMLAATQGQTVDNHPKRVVFGLPHNYFFSQSREKVDVGAASEGIDRRASPLFIHIHEFSERHFGAICALFPAVYLPKNEKIRVKTGRTKIDFSQVIDYGIIIKFLTHKYFPELIEVTP